MMRKLNMYILLMFFSFFVFSTKSFAADPTEEQLVHNQAFCKYDLNNLKGFEGEELGLTGSNYLVFDLHGDSSTPSIEGPDFELASDFQQRNFTAFNQGFDCSSWIYVGYGIKKDSSSGKYKVYLSTFSGSMADRLPYSTLQSTSAYDVCYKAISCVYYTPRGIAYIETVPAPAGEQYGSLETRFSTTGTWGATGNPIIASIDNASFQCEGTSVTYKCPYKAYLYATGSNGDQGSYYFTADVNHSNANRIIGELIWEANIINYQHNTTSNDEYFNFNNILTYRNYSSDMVMLVGADESNADIDSTSGPFDFCRKYGVLLTLDILHNILSIARILVPLLLIIFASIDLSKAVISGDEKSIKTATTVIIKRAIIGLIIFMIPSIVYSIIGLANGKTTDNCSICFTHKEGNCDTILEAYKNGGEQ